MLLQKTPAFHSANDQFISKIGADRPYVADRGDYKTFLENFLDRDYSFVSFSELKQGKGQIALRHDIDFDTHFALKCAKIEKELDIKATYFFLVRSDFYNILSVEDSANITSIKELGHNISIHFDSTLYDDCKAGLAIEQKLFENIFDVDVNLISFHRPNDYYLNCNETIDGIEHTYQFKYYKDIKYFSDSTGVWRYGHPFSSPEFADKKSIHLLIHPIWWMVDGKTNLDKLDNYFQACQDKLSNSFHENCKPFRKLYEYI